jgi:hypothetical protein
MYRLMFKLANITSVFRIVYIIVTVDIRQYFVLRCMYNPTLAETVDITD